MYIYMFPPEGASGQRSDSGALGRRKSRRGERQLIAFATKKHTLVTDVYTLHTETLLKGRHC